MCAGTLIYLLIEAPYPKRLYPPNIGTPAQVLTPEVPPTVAQPSAFKPVEAVQLDDARVQAEHVVRVLLVQTEQPVGHGVILKTKSLIPQDSKSAV